MAVIAASGMVVIIGYQLYDVARSAYGMSIAHASFQLGILGFVQFIPYFVLSPVAGVVADRFDRRYVAAAAMVGDTLVATGLAVTTIAGWHSLPALFVLAGCHGAVRVFINPAMSAAAPNIVPAGLIPRAIAFSSTAMQIGIVLGPAVFGFLYATHKVAPYACAAVLLASAAATLLAISRLPPPPVEARRSHPVRQIVDGFRFVWHDRFLLGCITLDLFAVLFGGATALLPVYARDILHVGPEGLGTMRAAPALGAAIVAMVLAFRPLERNVGPRMLYAVGLYGVMTVAFGLSPSYALSLLFLAGLGAADMISVFIRSSLVQLNTPDDVRGRVSAISGLAISASNELGEMQSGLAAAVMGPVGAVVFGGGVAIVVTAMYAWRFPEIRRARTFAPQYRRREQEP